MEQIELKHSEFHVVREVYVLKASTLSLVVREILSASYALISKSKYVLIFVIDSDKVVFMYTTSGDRAASATRVSHIRINTTDLMFHVYETVSSAPQEYVRRVVVSIPSHFCRVMRIDRAELLSLVI